jgi:hypothetical protein
VRLDFLLQTAVCWRQPFLLRIALRNIIQNLLQHLRGNGAHLIAPLLPEAYSDGGSAAFRPFGAVETHDFSSGNTNSSSPQTSPRLQ